jgi:hypothetical protein
MTDQETPRKHADDGRDFVQIIAQLVLALDDLRKTGVVKDFGVRRLIHDNKDWATAFMGVDLDKMAFERGNPPQFGVPFKHETLGMMAIVRSGPEQMDAYRICRAAWRFNDQMPEHLRQSAEPPKRKKAA